MSIGQRRAKFTRGADLLGRVSIKANRATVLRTLNLPRISVSQPVIRILYLPAVFNVLMEHPVFVADSVADDGQL